jgi:hypothetical protein
MHWNIKKKLLISYVKNVGDFHWLVSFHLLIIAHFFIIESTLVAKSTFLKCVDDERNSGAFGNYNFGSDVCKFTNKIYKKFHNKIYKELGNI